MALQRQAVSLQFSGGVETKVDAKQVPAARLLDLQNATFVKATTLAKRNGYRSLGLAVEAQLPKTLTGLVGMATRDNETIVFDGARAYGRREEIDAWSDTGEVCSTVALHRELARTGTVQLGPDHATVDGLTAVAWEDGRGGVWASLVDANTGRIVVADTQLDALGQAPRCIAIGARLHILYAVTSSLRIYDVVVDPANVTGMPAATVLVDNLSSTLPQYDACFASASSPNYLGAGGLIAWNLNGGGYEVGYVTESGQIGSTLTGFPSAAQFPAVVTTGPIAVAYDFLQSSIAVVFGTTGNVLAIQFSDPGGLSNVSGVTTLLFAPGALNRCAVAYAYDGKTDPIAWWTVEVDGGRADLCSVYTGAVSDDFGATTIVVGGGNRILRGHQLASRAFADLNLDPATPGIGQTDIPVAEIASVYVCVVHPVQFYPYVAVARISGSVWGSRTIVAARLLEGESAGTLPRAMLPSMQPINPTTLGWSRQIAFTLGYRIQLGTDDTQASSSNFSEVGIRRVVLDFDSDLSYQTAQLGHGLYLAGGLLQHYDGARWAEATFHAAPDFAIGGGAGAAETAGGSMTAATYNYQFLYEEIDNQGEIHPGAVSVPVQVVVAGSTSTVTIATIPTCRLTSKKNVRISVWRSPGNQTGQPNQIPYYRVTGLDPTVTTGANCYLTNDPTVNFVSFTDALSDLALIAREPLYTNGGILSNDPTPCAGGAITTGKSRLYYTDPSDPNVVRFTQQLRDDTGAEESPGLFVRVDPYGGDIVALSVLDDAIVAHKQASTMVFGGPGPDADGGASSQNGFTLPQLLTSDVGCSSPRSVVQTPLGVMFATSKGIVLLGRDRQMDAAAGDAVYGYKDQIISRATLLPDRRQVVFLTADPNGRTLLYDYEHQQWSTYTNHLGIDATVTDGSYVYVRTDGRVFRETIGQYADDNQHIPMLVSTAWLKMAGYLQGFQRVIHASAIGAYKSAHQLSMRFRIDYQEAWSEPILIDMAALYTGSSYGVGNYGVGNYDGDPVPLGTVYQAKWHINRRCQSIAFEFTDVEDFATFGASFELSELMLTGGVLGPAFPVGAPRSR